VTSETIVLVHGLWMNGMDMTLLRIRLRKSGYHCQQFCYATVRKTPLQNALDLNAYIDEIDSPTVHFVCHSLGGLVIRHLFHEYPHQRPGRIVTLGTPHKPSSAAKQFSRFALSRMTLGKSIVNGLSGNVPAWQGSHDLGVIAGTFWFGAGMLVAAIPSPSDGTVSVEETRLAGMQDHITLTASHLGLVLSRTAAKQIVYFLQHGQFK